MLKIYLRDMNQDVVDAWKVAFEGYDNIEASCGDIFDIGAEAIVSPANSFGYMDGGIDLVYRNRFGMDVETRLKSAIDESFYGEMSVGMGIGLHIRDTAYRFMIAVPTMRVPSDVSTTLNAYHAFRAALIAAHELSLDSILCPGLCTLTGRMHPQRSALQMLEAYKNLAKYKRFTGTLV
jgi:O-acetyl-ADP-ribose deacetylase (regulator of RNase III)